MIPRRGLAHGALRVTALLGPVVALLATGPAGRWPPAGLVAVVLVLSAGFATLPESWLGSAAFLVVVLWWGLGLRDGLHPAALVAAGALVAAHVAAVLAAYGPPGLPPDPALVGLWARRGLLVLLPAPMALAVSWAARSAEEPPLVWVSGVGAAVVAVLVAVALIGRDARA